MQVYIFVLFLGLAAEVEAEEEEEMVAGVELGSQMFVDRHCLLIGAVPYLVGVEVVEILLFWECMRVVC